MSDDVCPHCGCEVFRVEVILLGGPNDGMRAKAAVDIDGMPPPELFATDPGNVAMLAALECSQADACRLLGEALHIWQRQPGVIDGEPMWTYHYAGTAACT